MKIAHRNKTKEGFTLIELLVVISIIAILVTLVFAGTTGLIDRARSVEAKTMAASIKNGIALYNTEYRRMPQPDSAGGSGDFVDFASDKNLMDILLGVDEDKNPKKVGFLKTKPAKNSGGTPRGGLVGENDGSGRLLDPWGALYGIRVNVVNTDRIDNPYFSGPSLGDPNWGTTTSLSLNTNQILNDDIVVWSQGKDEDDSADNVTTFE